MPASWDSISPASYVGLAPWAWVTIDGAGPANPFEYIAGVHPDVVRALNDAREVMRGEIEAIIGDVAAGRIRFDDPRLPRLVEDAYIEVVASRPAIARHLVARRRGDGAFVWGWTQDREWRSTRELTALRFVNARARQVSTGELKALSSRAVGWLLGELDGSRTAGDLRAAIGARGDAEAPALDKLLGTLSRMGMLLASTTSRVRGQWLANTRDGDVVHLGHAGLACRAGENFLLFDPWLVPWNADAQIPALWPTEMPRPHAILLTHEHADHLDPRTLLAFAKDTPIIVATRRDGLFYDYRTQLERLGFTNVVELAHGARWAFPGGFVEAVPFYGEDPCDLTLPRNCYLVSAAGRNTLVWADSGPANNGTSPLGDGVVDDLARRHGRVDLVFTSQQQIHELRALSVYSAFTPPGTWFRSGENGLLSKEYLADVAGRVGARQVVSYATGGADWLADNLPFVFAGRNPRRTALITSTWEPLEALAPLLAARGCAWHHSRALDVYRRRPDGGTDVIPQVTALAPEQVFALDHAGE
jgi:hypothetical protein